jgi:hypothetical protein
VVERGRHAELIEVNGLYRRMWDLQNQLLIGIARSQAADARRGLSSGAIATAS